MTKGPICPECPTDDQPRIHEDGTSTTLLAGGGPYWEGGVRHDHDPNTITDAFHCARGHRWTVKRRRECPGCVGTGRS